MALPYPTKSRTWDLGTSANGTFFDTEFNQLYANDTYLLPKTCPSGMIAPFGGVAAPTGWLECDGSAVSRSTYAELFAYVGTTFGVGNGSTTFNVPDMRGLFVRGAGSHGTMTKAAGGAFAGGSVGATDNDKLQGHRHGIVINGGGALDYYAQTGAAGNDNGAPYDIIRSPVSDGTNGTPRTGNETKPASIALLYCIKT